MIYFSDFAAPAGGATDADNILLLGFEGSDGATTTTDESIAANGSPTFHNQAQIDTAQFKFGASSLLLDGSDKIVFADAAVWDFGAGPWTIEGFFKSADVGGFRTLLARANTSGNGAFMIDAINGTILRFRYNLNSAGQQNSQFGVTYGTTLWHHFAMDWDGSDIRFYFDSASLGKVTTANTIANDTLDLTIGATTEAGSGVTNGFNGWLDEFRISTVARYASDSGYTVPTVAFPR